VVHCDITNDKQCGMETAPDSENPLKTTFRDGRRNVFREERDGQKGWREDGSVPVMCVYAVIRIHTDGLWKPLANKAQAYVLQEVQEVWCKVQRLAFCWLDKWMGLSRDAAVAPLLASVAVDFPPLPRSGPTRANPPFLRPVKGERVKSNGSGRTRRGGVRERPLAKLLQKQHQALRKAQGNMRGSLRARL
jgi:hypothetical protein